MGKYLEKAKEIRTCENPRYNCAQSVMETFAELTKMDSEKVFMLTQHFGSGMRMGSVCGTITGGVMVLGLLGAEPSVIAKFYQDFKANHDNCLMCADLLRISKEKGLVKKAHCDSLVYEVVSWIENYLEEIK